MYQIQEGMFFKTGLQTPNDNFLLFILCPNEGTRGEELAKNCKRQQIRKGYIRTFSLFFFLSRLFLDFAGFAVGGFGGEAVEASSPKPRSNWSSMSPPSTDSENECDRGRNGERLGLSLNSVAFGFNKEGT